MNFDFTDDQQAIKRTANEMLAARFKSDRVRELAEAERYDDDAWKEMCELGWAGIFIDEEHGGQGLGIVELVILMEELGYALAPVPFLSNAAAGLALQFAGTDEQKERWLPGIASGEARGTVGMVRDGEARLVPDADTAEVIVLIGYDGATSVVEAAAAEIEPFETMDRTRRFARVRPTAATRSAATVSPRATGSRRRCPPRRWAWRRRRWRWPSTTRAESPTVRPPDDDLDVGVFGIATRMVQPSGRAQEGPPTDVSRTRRWSTSRRPPRSRSPPSGRPRSPAVQPEVAVLAWEGKRQDSRSGGS